MKWFFSCWILFGLIVAFLCGCEKPEDLGSFDWPWDHHFTSDAAAAETPAQTTQGATPTADAAAAKLVFRFGGFQGGRAVEDPETQVGHVRMNGSGMTYKWMKGNLRNWGLADTDASAVACFFYWDENEQAWIGGKGDWISTSRTSRDFENIRGGYGGWNPDAFFSAKRRAFCIVRKDGKLRTNLAEDGK